MNERKPYERKLRGRFLGWYIRTPSPKTPGKYTATWLGRDKREANANWERLKANQPIIRPEKIAPTDPLTVREAADAFLADIKGDRRKSDGTYKWYKQYLDSLCDFGEGRVRVGSVRFAELRKNHVKKWIAANPAWSDNTAHSAGRCAMALCNWLVKSDAERFAWITTSPLAGFEKAPATPRDCYITADEWKRILAVVDDELSDALTFMRLTGCRPDEMRRAEKRHFDSTIPAIVFPPKEWKCGRRSKVPRDRVIRLAGEALLVVQKRCLRHPDGPIFRGHGGQPITKDALSRRLNRLSVKLNIPHLIPYAIRHTFASDAAFKVDCLILAELLGTSVKMLERVYAKARKRMDLMGQAAARAIEGIA